MSYAVCDNELYTGELFTRTFVFTWVKLDKAFLKAVSDHKILEITLNEKSWKCDGKSVLIDVTDYLNNGANVLTVRTEWTIWDNLNPMTRTNLSVHIDYDGIVLCKFDTGWFERRWKELKEFSIPALIGVIALAVILIVLALYLRPISETVKSLLEKDKGGE